MVWFAAYADFLQKREFCAFLSLLKNKELPAESYQLSVKDWKLSYGSIQSEPAQAFLKHEKDAFCYVHIYLISLDQFCELAARFSCGNRIDFSSLQNGQVIGIPGAKRFYSHVAKISKFENLDVLTFAPPLSVREQTPTVDYVQRLFSAYKAQFHHDSEHFLLYYLHNTFTDDAFTDDELMEIAAPEISQLDRDLRSRTVEY